MQMEHIKSVLKDHLKDMDMILGYAKEAQAKGDIWAYDFFMNEVRARHKMFELDHKAIAEHFKATSLSDYERGKFDGEHAEMVGWYKKIEKRLADIC